MVWIETAEHNKRLFEALSVLAAERGALERLVGAINNDRRAHATGKARRGDKHQARTAVVVTSTLDRWLKGGLARVISAQPHKKRLVYEFLERSRDFRTDLYRPRAQLPAGLLDYAAECGARLSQPFVEDLSKLDGAFEMFRPAWTTRARRNRVLVTRLLFTTKAGFTRFREEQDYTDPDFRNAVIHEIDEGAVFLTAANLMFFGFGVNGERVKFFVADSWHDELTGPRPVTHLSGTMIGVSARKQHSGYPFVAIRTQKPFPEIETGFIAPTDPRLDHETRNVLGIAQ